MLWVVGGWRRLLSYVGKSGHKVKGAWEKALTKYGQCCSCRLVLFLRTRLVETNQFVNWNVWDLIANQSSQNNILTVQELSHYSKHKIDKALTIRLGRQHHKQWQGHQPPEIWVLEKESPLNQRTHHLISRFTAIPQPNRSSKTTGIAAIVKPNSAEFLERTTMRSCRWETRERMAM